jgi:hypothetical protein
LQNVNKLSYKILNYYNICPNFQKAIEAKINQDTKNKKLLRNKNKNISGDSGPLNHNEIDI